MPNDAAGRLPREGIKSLVNHLDTIHAVSEELSVRAIFGEEINPSTDSM
jgi:hypothetical protein